MKTLLLACFITLISCSISEEEKHKLQLISALANKCSDEFYSRKIYSKQTGEQITRESDGIFGRMPIEGACKAKAELFVDGHDVLPIIQFDDLRKFIMLENSGFKAYYKQLN